MTQNSYNTSLSCQCLLTQVLKEFLSCLSLKIVTRYMLNHPVVCFCFCQHICCSSIQWNLVSNVTDAFGKEVSKCHPYHRQEAMILFVPRHKHTYVHKGVRFCKMKKKPAKIGLEQNPLFANNADRCKFTLNPPTYIYRGDPSLKEFNERFKNIFCTVQ